MTSLDQKGRDILATLEPAQAARDRKEILSGFLRDRLTEALNPKPNTEEAVFTMTWIDQVVSGRGGELLPIKFKIVESVANARALLPLLTFEPTDREAQLRQFDQIVDSSERYTNKGKKAIRDYCQAIFAKARQTQGFDGRFEASLLIPIDRQLRTAPGKLNILWDYQLKDDSTLETAFAEPVSVIKEEARANTINLNESFVPKNPRRRPHIVKYERDRSSANWNNEILRKDTEALFVGTIVDPRAEIKDPHNTVGGDYMNYLDFAKLIDDKSRSLRVRAHAGLVIKPGSEPVFFDKPPLSVTGDTNRTTWEGKETYQPGKITLNGIEYSIDTGEILIATADPAQPNKLKVQKARQKKNLLGREIKPSTRELETISFELGNLYTSDTENQVPFQNNSGIKITDLMKKA